MEIRSAEESNMESVPPSIVNARGLRAVGKMLVPMSCGALSLLALIAIVPAITPIAAGFTRHGARNGQFMAQIVLIIAGLSSIVGAPVVAVAAKCFGKRPTLLSMLLLFSLSGTVGWFEPGFAALLISRIVLGFTGGALGMLGLVLITDYYHGPLRFRLLGISGTVQLASTILALILCGALVDRFGWGSAFAIYPVTGILILVVAFFCSAEPPAVAAPASATQKSGLVRKLLPVVPVYLVITIFIIGQFTVAIEGPFLLVKIGVGKAASQGMITAVPSVAAMISSFFFGWLYARFSERQIIIPVIAAVGAGITAIAFASSVREVVLYYVVIGLAAGIIFPASATMVISRAAPETREPALGMIFSFVGIGEFLNPVVTAPITHAFGVEGAFFAIGMVELTMALVLLASMFGRTTRRLEHTEEIIDTLV
jgi:predicted MFS family arabinose efflux permease